MKNEKIELALNRLFHGKCNIPEAASSCNVSPDEMKSLATDYIVMTPSEDWEVDIAISWPYLS